MKDIWRDPLRAHPQPVSVEDHTDIRQELDAAEVALLRAWEALRDRGLSQSASDIHRVIGDLKWARKQRDLT